MRSMDKKLILYVFCAVASALAQVGKDWGRAVLMVTHDPRIAAYADRIVFLKDGKIVSETHLDAKKEGNQEIVANEFRALTR